MRTRNHLPASQLLAFAENCADASLRARVADHLGSGCQRCAREVAFWARSLQALRPAAAPAALAPTDAFLQRAMTVFDRHAPQPTVWERLITSLAGSRRKAARAARKSDALFRLVFARNPLPMWVYDLETGQFLEVNDAALALYGYSRAEFLGLGWSDLEAEPVEGTGPAPVSSRVDMRSDRHRLRDSRPIDVQLIEHELRLGGRRVAMVVAEDITGRRQADAALRRSEARFRSLVEGAVYGVYRAGPDGRFLEANPALARMLGYNSEHDLLDLFLRDQVFLSSGDYAAMMEQVAQADRLDGFGAAWKRCDGQVIRVRLTGRAVREERGALECFEGIVEDVTERWQLEEQLRQSQKMDAIGRLAGGVAHDFNNLLAVITCYSELLTQALEPDGTLYGYAEETRRAAERAADLTRQLLTFSRKQVIRPQRLDLNAVLMTVERILRRLIGEDVELVLQLAEDLGEIEADPSQVDQLILNLALNARDAMPEGGRLTLQTANIYLDATYAHRHLGARPGDYVMLAVIDTGTGMDAQTQARIFEPFFTTKGPGKGTGLGLATVFGIIRQSGGEIQVNSELGRGTSFRVYLPRADSVEPGPVTPSHAAVPSLRPVATSTERPAGSGTEIVLLVEDDRGVRELVAEILLLHGYRVLVAESGHQALALSGRYTGDVHLLVTDAVMPGMSGRELAEAICPRYPAMKVLFMSGYTDAAIVRHGILRPGTTFIQKPFTPGALATRVRQVLDG